MKHWVASIFLSVFLLSTVPGQNKSRHAKRSPPQSGPIRICQGVPIPSGYVIVAYENSLACPHGAYVLQRDDSDSRVTPQSSVAPASPAIQQTAAFRPRRVGQTQTEAPILKATDEGSGSPLTPPKLGGTALGMNMNAPSNESSPATANNDEVSPGDVVRIDTNLVAVPVSVLDREGRFVPNLKREDFRVLENGVEQQLAYFEPTEKPFTVALVLDTSGSTVFHLSEIKEAAIAFAKQLRPQDRVLVVTFDDQVLLLTEATNNLDVVTEVIDRYANTGGATRLYDALDLVINERLNKIRGRKAIVLFTDGVDTSSYQSTYQSTLREAEELDALIYPVQYDTHDFMDATQGGNISIVTTRSSSWPFPSRSSSRTIYRIPSIIQAPGTTLAEYQLADQYLHQLAYKTGGRLYQANDNKQVADAFAKIAEELRYQYSLGYYPKTDVKEGERRQLQVHVNQPDLAVRARDSYVRRVDVKTTK